MRNPYRFLSTFVAFLFPIAVASAQTQWPVRPARLIVPYPPSVSGDLIIRKVTPLLARKLNSSFYVENRPGTNGNLGMKIASESAPDGYTFVTASDIQFAVSPSVYSHLPFDPDRDFAPVAPLARMTNVIVASRNLKANNLRELVALAKSEPGKITYASTGVGSTHQLFMELLKMQGGFDMLHVPYKGTGDATPDLISGRIDVMFFGAPQALAQVAAGQLKVLAVGSANRLEQFPGVPTISESGFPGFPSDTLWGVWAPAGTPDPFVVRLREAVAEALADPEIREWYRASVMSRMRNVDEMMKIIHQERKKWPEVIRAAHIKLVE